MEEKQRTKWERTRGKGMWLFVILWGVVMTGASFLATTLFDYFYGTQLTLERAGVRIAIFAFFGLASGLALWFITENKYRKGPK